MIQIKNYSGNVLKEIDDNSLSGADLSGADLSGAYLSRADLSRAYLSGADLSRADLSGADLSGAYLSGADLSGAYLSGADLSGANLSGVKFKDLVIKKIQKFDDLYQYACFCIVDENDEKYISLGCYTRKISEWEADFWNNKDEFPNDNSEKSNLRLFAYETCKKYFTVVGW
jgi:uncharacterized protein YjbI with pentapeptide repeats